MAELTTMTRVYTLAIRSLHMSAATLSASRNAPRKGQRHFYTLTARSNWPTIIREP